jgi:heat shock protein HslJ
MRTTCWITVLVLLATALIGAGCSSSGGTGGKLEGVRWVMKSYDSKGVMKNAPGDVSIDALFEGGNVSGFSGVNTYRGSYKLSGSSLSVGQLASTLMAGSQDLMDAEQAYLAALQRTGSYTADPSSLTLFDRSGKKILEYAKGKAPALTGGTWVVTSYFNGRDAITGVINGTRLTALFSSKGALTGSAGVNEYSSTYQSQGQNITIAAPVATTNNTSADAAIAQQEKDYLAALPLAAKYNIQGNRLDLLRVDGGFAVTFELAK